MTDVGERLKKILVIILTYDAGRHIAALLERIPRALFSHPDFTCDLLMLDDASRDDTMAQAKAYLQSHTLKVRLLKNPVNQGYGGNQKIGYAYAIENGYDVAVMLHGDGQYPPEMIEAMVGPLLAGEADCMLGSRMIERKSARKGGMPLYKFVGNIILTKVQNWLLGSRLSEFHTGFRAYSLKALASVPFAQNSSDFDFDTDILIQFLCTGKRIREIAIPTYYGDTVSHVNGMKYACQVIRNTVVAKLQPFGIFYDPKFDFLPKGPGVRYPDKTGFDSSHSWAVRRVGAGSRVLDLGCGTEMAILTSLKHKGCIVYAIGATTEPLQPTEAHYRQADFNDAGFALSRDEAGADTVLLMDVIEHLDSPELFLDRLHTQVQDRLPQLCITTANVGFVLVRLSLLAGQFNYGRRGILDLTHKRLFTFASIKRLLRTHGFQIESVEGIPAPFALALRCPRLAKALLWVNRGLIRLNMSWFSYQIAIVAKPLPSLHTLIRQADAGD